MLGHRSQAAGDLHCKVSNRVEARDRNANASPSGLAAWRHATAPCNSQHPGADIDQLVRRRIAVNTTTCRLFCALLLASAPALAAGPTLTPTDTAKAFKAAGFKLQGKQWVSCAAGELAEVRDINGDGQPEAIITESGIACHGQAEVGYSLVSRQPNGVWKLLDAGSGIPNFLKTKGVGGWPDLQVGGPGFCFPVLRWNGSEYALQRHEYEGKPCTPS